MTPPFDRQPRPGTGYKHQPQALAELAGLLAASGWRTDEDGNMRRPAWHARAACRGVGTEPFFPPLLGRGQSRLYREAKAAWCDNCPVQPECLAAGQHEEFGLWGGQSPSARQRRNPSQRKEKKVDPT